MKIENQDDKRHLSNNVHKMNGLSATYVEEKPQNILVYLKGTTNETLNIIERLDKFNYELKKPQSAQEFRALFPNDDIVCLLIDGDTDPYNIISSEELRSLREKKQINCPVIYLSNKQDFQTRLEAAKNQVDIFLKKPMELIDLLDQLHSVCTNRSSIPYRVLLIDDDIISLKYISLSLEDEGIKTLCLTNPECCISELHKFQPELILLDISMPNCDGYTLASIIRQEPTFAHVPIMFVTTDSSTRSQERAASCGGDGYLTKPIDPDLLCTIVRSKVSRTRFTNRQMTRLVDSEMRIKSLMENASDAIVTLDTNDNILHWNKSAETIFGHSREEVLGKSICKIIPEIPRENFNSVSEFLHEICSYKDKNDALNEISVRNKNGNILHIELSFCLWNYLGENCVSIFARDVSEQKLKEHQLRQSEAWSKAVIDNASDGIITLDNKGKIQTANKNAYTIFNYDDQSLVDKHISGLIDGISQFLDNTDVTLFPRESIGFRQNGNEFPIEYSASLISQRDDQNLIISCRDISAHKSHEQHLREARDNADKANLAKSQFLSQMSHELRTPLNSILGFSKLMQTNTTEKLEGDNLICINQIRDSGIHLLSLINEVLDLARVESGNVDLEIQELDASDLIQNCVDLLNINAAEKEISINFVDDNPQKSLVLADHGRLKQILINLISNAIKYNNPGGKVEIILERREEIIRIKVCDTGIGIHCGLHSLIFEPFSRIQSENKEIEGTGIGLSLCKKLVELMHGDIGFTSEIHKGSVFWVDIPTPNSTTNSTSSTSTKKPLEDNETFDDHPCKAKILYVEKQ